MNQIIIETLYRARAALYTEPQRCTPGAWAEHQVWLRATAIGHIDRLIDDICSNSNRQMNAERVVIVLRTALEALMEQPAQCGAAGWTAQQVRLRRDAKHAIRNVLVAVEEEKSRKVGL